MSNLYTSSTRKFTTAQLLELGQVFERAVAERTLPELPKWYCDLPVPERGEAVVGSRRVTSRISG